MSISTLLAALAEISGGTFIGLDTTTVPVLTGGKKNTMQGRVKKIVNGSSVMTFSNQNSNGYSNMVARRLADEGKDPESFTLSPRKWGQRVPNMPVVEHKGKRYLEVIFLKAGTVSYTLDNQPIDKADIEGLKTSPEGNQGGLDNKVIIRDYNLESLNTVRINGDTIRVA
jgi:hypothetical protein